MKYLLITLEYFPFKGGVANYYTNLVQHWPQNSSIQVLDNKDKKLSNPKSFLISNWIKSIKTVKRELRETGSNYLLVGQILPLGKIAWYLSRIKKTKYALFFHGLDLSLSSRNFFKKTLSQKIIKRADKIICANSYVAKKLQEVYRVDQAKVRVVNPGVNDFNFDKKINKSLLAEKYQLEGKMILFSLGRLVKRKGFDYTILALKEIAQKDKQLFSKIKYIISGAGPDESYLRDLALKTFGPEFGDNIVFTGEISEDEKWTFLSLSDIFVMPARNIAGDYEGFGIVFLEANLLSTALIAGRSGGMADAVRDGYNGLLVDPESIGGISSAICKLLKNDNLRILLGKQGRERVVKEFSWSKKINDIYNFL